MRCPSWERNCTRLISTRSSRCVPAHFPAVLVSEPSKKPSFPGSLRSRQTPRRLTSPILPSRINRRIPRGPHPPQGLGAAYEKYGFVILRNHGVSDALIKRSLECSKDFFALPAEKKMEYHLAGKGGARGYTAFGVETAKGSTRHDLKEFWHLGRDLPVGHRFEQQMPPNVLVEEGDFTEATGAVFTALDALGRRVLEALAVHLGVERSYFANKVDEGNSILRVIHYPPLVSESEDPEQALAAIENEKGGHVRAAAHEDINLITLLLGADEGGLQLLRRDGRWMEVTPPPGCVTCNIGDMLQRLTNHRLPSTTHRVVNPTAARAKFPRYSMPFFLHPNPDFVIDTLESCVSETYPNKYPTPITSDEYLQQRLREIKLK
jgi:isopenicillin N synthase-like dioxygenase